MSGVRGFELVKFQALAARQIADRFELLNSDPDGRPMFTRRHAVPFFQGLSALTGAGKTAILAQAVADMAVGMPVAPIVLWVTRLRVVVEQSFSRLRPGGSYASLMPRWNGAMLSDLTRDQVGDATEPLLVAATVASFNRDSPEDSSLLVHQVRADEGDDPIWTMLQNRQVTHGAAVGVRRPLFVVYDEAHNLTDPQTKVLMGLEPDAFLAASGTLSLREGLGDVLGRLRMDGWGDSTAPDIPGHATKNLITQVPNKAVVDAGLVKREIVLGGYDSSMDALLDDLLGDMATAVEACELADLSWRPRAIYVSQTNIRQDDGTPDNHRVPFENRRSPPILIWRYLVSKNVDPAKIAVYSDLKVDKANPLPPSFRLFAGGDRDFAAFTAGEFQHIIFNQALQEGWDDPLVSFGYIDKTMGSKTAVEQVIGRVLRQPGASHLPDPLLNTATFFVRLEDKQGFRPILENVQRSLGTEPGGVALTVRSDVGGSTRQRQMPKIHVAVPRVFVVSDEAEASMDEIISGLPDHTGGGPNTSGVGSRSLSKLEIGTDAPVAIDDSAVSHSSAVTARWIVAREMRSLYPDSLVLLDPEDSNADKLDVLVDRTSSASVQFRQAGRDLVKAYLEGSRLHVEDTNLLVISALDVDPTKATPFTNAVHAAYDLNKLEVPIARAIDATGLPWCRNPSGTGFRIPLLDAEGTRNFYPDFLVWADGNVFAIDPKGPHLLRNDAGRKTMNIASSKGGPKIISRLISEGKWTDELKSDGPGGYTVWRWDPVTSAIKRRHFSTADLAVGAALKV